MRIEDDNGISTLLASPETRLCAGFGFTEGPVWIADDDALIFSDIPGNRAHRWRPGASDAEVYREPTGWGNGMTLDRAGNVLVCEHGGRRVSRFPYGRPDAAETVAAAWHTLPLNSPNDLVVHSSGAIYFTDPTYGQDYGGVPRFGEEGQKPALDFQGVYRVSPDGRLDLVIRDGFSQPNGLAFSPDESVLYVGDSQERVIWRYELDDEGTPRNGTLFIDQRGDAREGLPDGMKVDTEGRLWTTGAGGVSVHTARGQYLGVFELDEHAANLCFGGDAYSTLFLTASTGVYSVQTSVIGLGPNTVRAKA
jgi:gluconolactonase